MPVAFGFEPRGWALCNGQMLSISQNSALFSLLGTSYGGDGRSTFGLPDLRGRVAVGQGQGPGLSPVQMGEVGGASGIAGGTVAVDNSGNGQPTSIPVSVSGQASVMQPFTGVNYIICLEGIFPSRN
ncbi:MAG: tail fiber protein [Pseudomonadota bacterium]|nr:tail fiber protein [Pseudomonadota bacterium]